MTKESDYRKNAAETLDLARRAVETSEKRRLLALTEKWLDLADRAQKIASRLSRRGQTDHPAVAEKLGKSSVQFD